MQELIIDSERKLQIDASKLPTLIEHFYRWEKETPQRTFLRQPIGSTWKEFSWAEVGNQARRMTAALKALQLPPKSHIGIVSKNCVHWVMSDLAIMMSGHISVPLFPTLTSEQIHQILAHSDTQVLFVGKLDNWALMKDGIPDSVQVITYPHYTCSDLVRGDNFLLWDDLIESNEPSSENYIPKLSDLITICYTSGTTGTPKGVMLSYYAFAKVYDAIKEKSRYENGNTSFLSYLPMNHMAERLVVEAAGIVSGGQISFVESLDSFFQNLKDTRPTHFFGVPRIWAKFQQGVLEKMPQKKIDTLFKIPIISRLVKKKIRKGLGLDRVRVALTGAAPMPTATLRWYHQLGLVIREGYGMSENTAACTAMPEENPKIGTVGIPHPGCELSIDPENGEILMRAEWVMDGYYKNPEKTAEVIQDGWLRTGDQGKIDEEGFLIITGRVKELFKTSKGEYVSPFTLESRFAGNVFIEQICVVGAGLPQPIALLILSPEGQRAELNTLTESLKNTLVEVNQGLYPYEHIKKLIVIRDEWSVNTGILTPTLKTKRNVIDGKYQDFYEKWFKHHDQIIFQ
ncbi:MAG: AMP-binding protein [Microscillaceae bacterium]|nr:AMP-binding protein [Microscillaceae bacterium]